MRVERTWTDNPASFTVAGDTIGVVHTAGRQTIATIPASDAVSELLQVLDSSQRPAIGSTFEVDLPGGADQFDGLECDILLFADQDRDREWDQGVPYVSAWTGGLGTYRVVYLSSPDESRPGTEAGWNLVEGGQPRTYQPRTRDTVVYVNPVVEPVEGR